MIELRPFQREFINRATAPGIDTAALSLPRGNGKSALAGYLVSRVLTPADELFRVGTESVLCAGSIEQARIVFSDSVAAIWPTLEVIRDIYSQASQGVVLTWITLWDAETAFRASAYRRIAYMLG